MKTKPYSGVKIPKQFRYWCKKYHLKPRRGIFSYRHKYYDFKGLGRYWRITASGTWQTTSIFDFDRWANSEIVSVDLPQTEKEFENALLTMISGKTS